MTGFREYLHYAKKLQNLAEDKIQEQENTDWLLIPAVILAWSAIESFVNNRCDDLSSLPRGLFELHEIAFLQEKRLRLEDSGINIGKFSINGKDYQSLENKIFFLLSKMGSQKVSNIKGGTLWQEFISLKEVRDNLIHPRKDIEITLEPKDVKKHIDTAQELIQMISKNIWKKRIMF